MNGCPDCPSLQYFLDDAQARLVAALSDAEALQSTLRQVQAERDEAIAGAEKWQPIESAPRDGTKILAYLVWPHDEHTRPTYAVIRWSNFESWHVDFASLCGDDDPSIGDFSATHWRALPAPPAIGGENS